MPIITLGFIGNIIYSKSLEDEINSHTIQMIQQVETNVEFQLQSMENLLHYISQDPIIKDFLHISTNLDKDRINIETEVRRILDVYGSQNNNITGILVVNKHDYYISNEMYRVTRLPLIQENWYKQAINEPEKLHLFSRPIGRNIRAYSNRGADKVISIVKAISTGDDEEQGVILLDIDVAVIENIIKGITLGKNGFIFLMDNEGDIVYTPINNVVYRVNPKWLHYQNNIFKYINGSLYQLVIEDSNYTNWKTVGVFSVSESIGQVLQMRNYTIAIGAITLGLAVILSLIISSSIAKPVRQLTDLMEKVEGGELEVSFQSKKQDEVSRLGYKFNNMIQEIRNLIEMVYSVQKRKRESELKVLQAQIKPHFLYNTLDTINWMARKHGAMDIVSIISDLTDLFRIGLSKGNQVITVEEELKHIICYLRIQKARYRDKLNYTLDAQVDTSDLQVLKLILQPIVENAIYHGVKMQRKQGHIKIQVSIQNHALIFVVEDDGPGIEHEQLSEINNVLKSGNHHIKKGYGMFNVNERVQLTFGEEYGVSIQSEINTGTRVCITHPLIKRGDLENVESLNS